MENNNYSYTLLHEIDDIFNDEIDIIVKFKNDNSKFHVTFLTYQKVEELMREEHNFILYSNTILIKSLTKENIEDSLKYTIDNNMYLNIFYPINDISIKKLNEKFDLEKEI